MKINLISMLFFLLLSSCSNLLNSNLKKANDTGESKRIASEFVAGLNADSLAAELVNGLAAGLNDSLVRSQIQDFISGILTQSGSATAEQIDSIKTILLVTLDELSVKLSAAEDTLLGSHLQLLIHNLKMELLGDDTNHMLSRIVNNLKDSLLNDDTKIRLGELRDELLGDKTNRLVTAIVDSAVSVALRKSSAGIKEDTGIIKKYANQILYTACGVIAALLLVGYYIWRRKQNYALMIKSVTAEIEKSGTNVESKDLKLRIQKRMKDDNLEYDFHSEFISPLNRRENKTAVI